MAKHITVETRKFKRLLATLRPLSRPHLLGHLELLWRNAALEENPHYDTITDIEAAAEWEGDTGKFASALTDGESPWINTLDDGTYEIHDFWEHAPEYVKARVRKRLQRTRNEEETPKTQPDNTGQTGDKAENVTGQSRDSHGTVTANTNTTTNATTNTKKNTKKNTEDEKSADADPLKDFSELSDWFPILCQYIKDAHPLTDIPKSGTPGYETWRKSLRWAANKYGEDRVKNTLVWVFSQEPQPDNSTEFSVRRNIRSIATLNKPWRNGLTAMATAIEKYEKRNDTKKPVTDLSCAPLRSGFEES